MKIKLVPSIIALGFAMLISYAIYSMTLFEESKLVNSIVGGIYLFLTLWGTMGYTLVGNNRVYNLKICSGLFFVVGLIMEIFFLVIPFSLPVFIIAHGLLFLLAILILHTLYNLK